VALTPVERVLVGFDGPTDLRATIFTNEKLFFPFALPEAGDLVAVQVHVATDGLTDEAGSFRAAVYTDETAPRRLAVSSELAVADGQLFDWIRLPFTTFYRAYAGETVLVAYHASGRHGQRMLSTIDVAQGWSAGPRTYAEGMLAVESRADWSVTENKPHLLLELDTNVVYEAATLTRLKTQLNADELTFTFPHKAATVEELQLLDELARSYPITSR
jgi:hypothetical protein